MKKHYTTTAVYAFVSTISLFIVCLLFANVSNAQSYYSKFENPDSHSYVINASGATCTAPAIQNATAFADTVVSNYSSFTITNAQPFTCTQNPYYHFVANLNVPGDTTLLAPGYKAGFKIGVPGGISLDSLQKYTVVSTYTNKGTLVEAAYTQQIMGVDSNANGIDWYLYFVATKPFNTVEINVDPNIALANTNFEFDVYYAVASKELVFPAFFKNFRVSTTGNNVQILFQTLTATNVSHFSIQRSSNNGTLYKDITQFGVKRNGNTSEYSYNDNALQDGSYLYRIATVNKDGSTQFTASLEVLIKRNIRFMIYPSIAAQGQPIIIKTAQTGWVHFYVYDAMGRLVQEQKTNSSGEFTMHTAGLAKNIYYVKLVSVNGNVEKGNFIITR